MVIESLRLSGSSADFTLSDLESLACHELLDSNLSHLGRGFQVALCSSHKPPFVLGLYLPLNIGLEMTHGLLVSSASLAFEALLQICRCCGLRQ